jgi:hypothetical protein
MMQTHKNIINEQNLTILLKTKNNESPYNKTKNFCTVKIHVQYNVH